ncbi:MAG: FecR domain-containing protein [Cyclobacteriaceae bacterium]|nr:FecR domain-containing protein [Cyclobacteriaceae bacterium HetDA_MAG_MS6]
MKEAEDKYHKLLQGDSVDLSPDDELASFLEKSAHAKPPPFKKTQKEIWDSIDQATDNDTRTGTRHFPSMLQAAIVSLALVATVTFLILSPSETVELVASNTSAGAKEINLPDGSIVTMNTGSNLTYTEGETRDVVFEGEGFFKVVKGSRFVVKTKLGTVTVLGTSFNIYARGDQFTTICKTGKVQVVVPDKQYNEVITPGKGITASTDTIKVFQQIPELIGQWRKGEFYFDRRPVTEVLDEVRRQYDIDIQMDSLEDQLFSGYFTKQDLPTALSMVCDPLGLSYEILDEKTVVIRR